MKINILGNHAYLWSLIACLSFATSSCDKDEEKAKGKPINAPDVEPPVARNLPSGLKGASLTLQETARTNREIALDALKNIISPAGDFVGVVQRLKKIDEALAQLDLRAQDSPRACLEETNPAKDYSIGASLPGSQALAFKLQCEEDFDVSAQLAFGLTDSNLYLIERNGSGLAVFATANLAGTSVSIWQLGVSTENTSAVQIQAGDGEGFEATLAATDISGRSGAASCGIHIRSNGTLIYMRASVAASGCSAVESYCVNASTLADADTGVAACTAASLDQLKLTSLTSTLMEASKADIATIVNKKISGMIDFTKGIEEPVQ